MDTMQKGPFLGVNNRLPDFALRSLDKRNPGDYLRKAENVAIDNAGRVRRRKAAALLHAMSGAHSLYMDSAATGYLVRNGVMYRIVLPEYAETFITTLTTNDSVSYVDYAGSLYWSNGVDSGRIEGGVNFPWALPTPVEPTVVSIAGSMHKGRYQVSTAHYNNVTKEEGGVSPSQNHQLVGDGALRITIPAPVSGATHVNVYVSTVDGSVPMLQATVLAGTASVDVTSVDTGGLEAFQRYEAPLPPGAPFLHNGALCCVSGNAVYRGIPYRPGYRVPSESRILFPGEVTNAVSAQNGLYVTTAYVDEEKPGTTYWLAGQDLRDVQILQDVLPYGAVKGTAFIIPFNSKVGWFGARGIVIADTQGGVEAVMTNNVDLVPPASGVAHVESEGGFFRVTSCGWTVNLENFAASTYTGFDFSSVSGNYGTNSDGLHVLSHQGDVPWVIGLGKEDFGVEVLKSLPAAYLGVDSDTPVTLSIQTPDSEVYDYPARSSGATTRIQRVDPGKGLRANWFDLSISGVSEFTLASVSFAPNAYQRRI